RRARAGWGKPPQKNQVFPRLYQRRDPFILGLFTRPASECRFLIGWGGLQNRGTGGKSMISKKRLSRGRKKNRRNSSLAKNGVGLKDLKKWVPEIFLKWGTKTMRALGI